MARFKVSVDKEKCIGCGSCVAVCEANFEMRDSKAIAKKAVSELACNKEAADVCPTHAIILKKA